MNMRFVMGCLVSAAVFCGCTKSEAEENAPAAGETAVKTETKAEAPAKVENKSGEAAPETKEKQMTVVIIETSKGNITVELDAEKAPVSVKNFLEYVDEGFYTDTIFHRVIKGFMVQGGGFTEDMSQKKTKAPIKIESANGLKNERGTLAMARTNVPDSATSQFFINHKNNDFLNYTAPTMQGYGYAVFGRVTDGMDVVDAIAEVKTGQKGPHGDVPLETVVIKKISRKE